MLNELSRSMGQPDFYPFVLPPAVIAKLHFIHLVIQQEGGRADEVLQDLLMSCRNASADAGVSQVLHVLEAAHIF